MTDAVKRVISRDIKELKKMNLEEQGIFIEFNEDNILKARAVIIGPKGTPYENGLLYFKIKFPKNYPYSPPDVKYYSYSKIRIHPNLYVGGASDNFEGKVCLSIINTWSGPKWTTVMHIGSVLLSLLSLLDENPLRNEPGYESITGKYNDIYNKIVEYDKYNHLLLNNGFDLGDDYEIFRDRVNKHLHDNREDIFNRLNTLIMEINDEILKSNIYGKKIIKLDYMNIKKKLECKFDNI